MCISLLDPADARSPANIKVFFWFVTLKSTHTPFVYPPYYKPFGIWQLGGIYANAFTYWEWVVNDLEGENCPVSSDLFHIIVLASLEPVATVSGSSTAMDRTYVYVREIHTQTLPSIHSYIWTVRLKFCLEHIGGSIYSVHHNQSVHRYETR